jgi:hypothetical protein
MSRAMSMDRLGFGATRQDGRAWWEVWQWNGVEDFKFGSRQRVQDVTELAIRGVITHVDVDLLLFSGGDRVQGQGSGRPAENLVLLKHFLSESEACIRICHLV